MLTKKQTEIQALAIECLHSLSAEDAIRTALEALRLHRQIGPILLEKASNTLGLEAHMKGRETP